MAVKHTDPHTEKVTVHKGKKGETTPCGKNTNDNPSHWKDTSEKITCERRECKN